MRGEQPGPGICTSYLLPSGDQPLAQRLMFVQLSDGNDQGRAIARRDQEAIEKLSEKGESGLVYGRIEVMNRTMYLTDLSDAEWECIAPVFPPVSLHGRPRLHSQREIINAILYLLRSGCAWRLLPHDLPPWKTVYHYFRVWRLDGTWERLHT